MSFGMKKRRPYNKSTGRDYSYDTAYESSEEQKKHRAARNKARRTMQAAGKVHKGDGKDVDHRRPLESGGSNSKSNWRVQDASENRGFARTAKNKPLWKTRTTT